jgi:hypothetical protein
MAGRWVVGRRRRGRPNGEVVPHFVLHGRFRGSRRRSGKEEHPVSRAFLRADGRTRTGDPFITSACRARDVEAVAGMDRHKVPAQRCLVGNGARRGGFHMVGPDVPVTYLPAKMPAAHLALQHPRPLMARIAIAHRRRSRGNALLPRCIDSHSGQLMRPARQLLHRGTGAARVSRRRAPLTGGKSTAPGGGGARRGVSSLG